MATVEQVTSRRGLFRGEWFLLLLVFVISCATGYFYTRSQLNREDQTAAVQHSVEVSDSSNERNDQ